MNIRDKILSKVGKLYSTQNVQRSVIIYAGHDEYQQIAAMVANTCSTRAVDDLTFDGMRVIKVCEQSHLEVVQSNS